MNFKATEKGQALILITLAAVGLFAFAALAIDGSIVFSDRRHAQNAADTSALAAALKRVHGEAWNVVEQAARDRATSNGYTDNGVTIVEVYLCDDPHATCNALPQGAKPDEYIQVKITSHVQTTFARVIGRTEMTNHVDAVAHAIPGYRTSTFGGQSLVSLSKDACPAFDYGGNGTITVTGSGIFINSRCDDSSNGALDSDASGTRLSIPCSSVVGTQTIGHEETLINTGECESHTGLPLFMPNPLANFPTPKITCDKNDLGTALSTGTTTTITPGYYDSRNTGNSFPSNSWQSNVVMSPGIYCIDIGQTFSLSGGQVLTGSNVLIYMINGGISWTSGEIHLSAMQGIDPMYDGLLLYMAQNPPAPDTANCDGVSITGNGGSSFVGTIMAPCSLVKIAGGSDTGNVGVLENQIVADRINLSGGADLVINFNAHEQWQPPVPPEIQMNQ